ncbi:MAG: PEP-CTERM sorting domain-containing protein [Sedimentisphaerales bacterium]|nr:PEP-CTERM sorting domain-containing protein [Sedimentisphaerales bacterium]
MVKKLILLLVMLMSVPAFGSLALLSSSDAVLAVDRDGLISRSDYPAGEAPPKALDQNSGTKYLNFARANTGFIVTLGTSGASAVQSFTLTTANDAAGRDPASWALWGTNDAITSADNSTGLAENWTLIGSGSVTLPDDRFTLGPVVSVSNSTAYSSYRMLYPTLKGGAGELMQVADVAYYASTDGTGTNLLAADDPILAIHNAQDSSYPGAESPANLVDGSLNKYLNFGKVNSGFIVTPAMGTTVVTGFEITTANDSPERDPAAWELYGTLDAILSGDNTEGEAETWTLIASGTVALPDDRNMLGDLVEFSNSAIYTSYKMLFTDVKDAGAANSMQIAEIQFYGVPEPATMCLLGLGGLALIRRRRS